MRGGAVQADYGSKILYSPEEDHVNSSDSLRSAATLMTDFKLILLNMTDNLSLFLLSVAASTGKIVHLKRKYYFFIFSSLLFVLRISMETTHT